ncbi:hypothetical protein CBW56_16260 [Denitratisoma oestradiolicum]|nr:hypothetical protein CBW56_16260 [Denitratisoma oestradiolicum]
MHYRTAGDGPPLLLLHQAPLCSLEWEKVIPQLARNYQVIAPDMMGHGNSDDPPREFEMEDFTRTTLQFMDALGIKRAILGGNHSGAALALSIAVNHPERVSHLILSCEMLVTREEIDAFLEKIKNTPMSRDLPMDDQGKFLVEAWGRYKLLAPTASPATRFLPFVIGQEARLRPFDAHYAVLRWLRKADRMPQIQCPTLVFGPENDLFFNIPRMNSALTRIADCQTVIIKDAGAMCAFEKPTELASAIQNFISASMPR